jgi:ThiF family
MTKPLELVVCGAGSIGAKLIDSLARSHQDPLSPLRLSRLTIVDRDHLEADNLTRHVALPADVAGEPRKVDFLARRVAALAPDVEVEAVHGSLFEAQVQARLEPALDRADLVISAMDNPPSLFKLNSLVAARPSPPPLLVSEVISGGLGIWLLAAFLTPDGPCVLDLARARGEDVALEERDGPAPEIDYADPASVVPAARVPAEDHSCAVAAALMAGLVCDAARRGGRPDPAAAPLRLLALRRVDEPAAIAPFFRAPLQLSEVPGSARRDDCPVCSLPHRVDEAQHEEALDWFEDEDDDDEDTQPRKEAS